MANQTVIHYHFLRVVVFHIDWQGTVNSLANLLFPYCPSGRLQGMERSILYSIDRDLTNPCFPRCHATSGNLSGGKLKQRCLEAVKLLLVVVPLLSGDKELDSSAEGLGDLYSLAGIRKHLSCYPPPECLVGNATLFGYGLLFCAYCP